LRKKALQILISLLLLISVCCGETVTLIDFTGHQVELSAPVTKTVSLSAAASEILWALDEGKAWSDAAPAPTFPQ